MFTFNTLNGLRIFVLGEGGKGESAKANRNVPRYLPKLARWVSSWMLLGGA